MFVKLALKYKVMYAGVLSQSETSLSLKNAWLPYFFFLDAKSNNYW